MSGKVIVFLSVFVVSNAVPVWFETVPEPSVSFGFGSGFSSNIGGISHSNSMGAAYRTGNAAAYGSGMAGNNFAQGVGIAQSAPAPAVMYHQPTVAFSRPSYNAASSTAQNMGYGSAASNAQSQNQYGSAQTAAQSHGLGHWDNRQSALSTAHALNRPGHESALSTANSNGLGFNSAMSAAENTANYQSAISMAHRQNGPQNYDTAVAAAQNNGAYRQSIAQSIQQHGNNYQNAGASAIDGPGLQAAHSHAFNTRLY